MNKRITNSILLSISLVLLALFVSIPTFAQEKT